MPPVVVPVEFELLDVAAAAALDVVFEVVVVVVVVLEVRV
jgi:hypothetical protein